MCFKAISLLILVLALGLANCDDNDWDTCGRDLKRSTGFDNKTDINFFRKLARTLNLFKRPQMQMSFFLYKQEFPNCGQELKMDDDSLQKSGFNVSHPTRIVIHGWMSESRSPFGRDVKDAYLSIGDFNVIIIDWSVASGTLNYYRVVNLIDDFGEIVANFTKHLHNTLGVSFDDMYLVGHSLGAQIAGSAGRLIAPKQFNTIFALDPAGPAFRGKPLECRIDPTDAKYVESIQTSVHLGLAQPVGHGSFFPNKGVFQKCMSFGCSHTRAYKFFAESLTSRAGFWGIKCDSMKRRWNCYAEDDSEYRMGGEPSQPKAGTFYVKTRGSSPYAMGRVISNAVNTTVNIL